MFNPGAHLRVLNFPPTARGRKAEARHKILPKLTDGHFKETLRKLDSLDRKKRASSIALSNKMPSHVAKNVTEFIASGKRRNTRRKRGSSRGRSRRVKTRGKRTRNSRGSRSRRGSKRGTRRGSRRGKR